MAKLRNNRNICLNCFGNLGEDRVCLNCGKAADDKPNSPHQLQKRSLLQKRYLIDRAIGEGGFGITYSAWDITNSRHVAIKEYYPSGYVSRDPRSNQIIINAKQNHAASNRGLKRFIDEAQNLSKIKNLGGIVNVFDFFSANNTAYIVMEFLDGISLKRYIRRKGKLDAATALTILKPVILSLEEVHAAGLIHRDISPDNILITKHNEVKLIDFGASKHANPDGQSVSIVLKQGFAPEEQYRLHGEQGPWTDVYALGVTIYYCITAQLPPESIQRMYDDTIVPPSALGANISPSSERALMKALAVFAKDRYRSVAAFAKDVYLDDDREREEDFERARSAREDEDFERARSARERDEDFERARSAREREDFERARSARERERDEDFERARSAREREDFERARSARERGRDEDFERARSAREREEDLERARSTRERDEDFERARSARERDEDLERARSTRERDEDLERARSAREDEYETDDSEVTFEKRTRSERADFVGNTEDLFARTDSRVVTAQYVEEVGIGDTAEIEFANGDNRESESGEPPKSTVEFTQRTREIARKLTAEELRRRLLGETSDSPVRAATECNSERPAPTEFARRTSPVSRKYGDLREVLARLLDKKD